MINFLKNLFGLSMKGKVMKVINQRINDAQKALDNDVENLRKRKSSQLLRASESYRDSVAGAKFSFTAEVEQAEEKHLNQLLAKIL